jgi:acyl-CoA dehydrogenase
MPVDHTLLDLMTSVFADHTAATGHGSAKGSLDRGLWDTLSSLGLTRLTTPLHRGGSGAGWAEAAALLRTAAAHGVSVPLAENDLLADRLLAQAGLEGDDGLRTACILDSSGVARAVPWARDADHVVALWWTPGGWRAADLPAASLVVEHGTNLAGEPRDDVTADLTSARGASVAPHVPEELLLRGALARAVQMTGAMDRILDLCVTHVTTRSQFGRPLARFQPLQHLIADMAAEAALADAATNACLRNRLTPFTVAVARSCAGHAATTVVRGAHQIHGAMGTTAEHPLHTLTLPTLSWRAEFGSLHDWDDQLTTAIVTTDRGLWPAVTDDCSGDPGESPHA